MTDVWIIYDFEQHKVYSESEHMWSITTGTYYPTQQAAHDVVYRERFDLAKVGTIHLFNY